MSTIINFELKELKKLANDTKSCVVEKKVTQNIALQPWCLGNVKESIKNILDYKIGKFDKEFNGILLSYKNLRIPQTIGTIHNDNADIHFQIQVDYYIFQPFVGATLTGIVKKKSITHLAILVHRVFNVVILRPTEEPGDKWIGTSIQEGKQVTFKIVVLDMYGALPYIRGELDESCNKLDLDGDEDEVSNCDDSPLNVSHVDFDKTKPYSQKQRSDGLPQSTSNYNSNSPDTNKVQNSCKGDEDKCYVSDNNKVKRQSKSLHAETNPIDLEPKVAKKTRHK